MPDTVVVVTLLVLIITMVVHALWERSHVPDEARRFNKRGLQ